MANDVYGEGAFFGPNETVGPHTVVGPNASFIGAHHGNHVHVKGPIIIGPGATFRYTDFSGGETVIIEDGYIDAGHNNWNGSPLDAPSSTYGHSGQLANGCCSQTLTSDGEKPPKRIFSNKSCGPCEVKK